MPRGVHMYVVCYETLFYSFLPFILIQLIHGLMQCEKTMLLVEEKQIPINVNLVNMRSYGDKPREFLQKVPNGLLPALEMPNGQIVTESQVIMELLDEMHAGKTMLPQQTKEGWNRYDALAKLERELFSWWCTLLFRPAGGIMGGIFSQDKMSGAMKGFLECIGRVDKELSSTNGPWFFDEYDYPTMIDFIYVSHIERMLASCAYWQGLNLRDVQKWNLKGLNNWLDAFDKRESYLAFKSDYYTNVKDIPPQYGPGYDGGFEQDRNVFQKNILGQDGSWTLPISHDDLIQPLYRGPPLPLCVLEATDLKPNDDGSYESCDPVVMAKACREMAAWKLADNGINVSRFAARGGPAGAKNPRKTFGAELADPYADPDDDIRPVVDAALRCVCDAMLDDDTASLDGIHKDCLLAVVPTNQAKAVVSSMVYLRDRVGVPRDLPLAAARYLRAYLNWGIDVLS